MAGSKTDRKPLLPGPLLLSKSFCRHASSLPPCAKSSFSQLLPAMGFNPYGKASITDVTSKNARGTKEKSSGTKRACLA